MISVQQVIEFLGTFAFAISGLRHAAAKQFDWFGGYVCGVAALQRNRQAVQLNWNIAE